MTFFIAEVNLDISSNSLRLKTPKNTGNYELDLPLPFPVKDELGTAKFDKSSRCLTVTLPVVPAKPVKRHNLTDSVSEAVIEAEPQTDEIKRSVKPAKSESKTDGDIHKRWICSKARGIAGPEIQEAKQAAAKLKLQESDEESAVIVSPDKSSDEGGSKDSDENWILLNKEGATQAESASNSPECSEEEKELTKTLTTPLEAMAEEAQRGNCDETNDFIPAKTFQGEKKGYIYKSGSEGTGYYLTNPGKAMEAGKALEAKAELEESEDERVELSEEVTGLSSLQLQNRDMFRLD